MRTSAAARRHPAVDGGRSRDVGAAAMSVPLATAQAALSTPDIDVIAGSSSVRRRFIVGSSFGSALAMDLVRLGRKMIALLWPSRQQ